MLLIYGYILFCFVVSSLWCHCLSSTWSLHWSVVMMSLKLMLVWVRTECCLSCISCRLAMQFWFVVLSKAEIVSSGESLHTIRLSYVPLFMVQPESSLTNFSKDERVRGDEGRLVANPLSELDLDKRCIILCYVCQCLCGWQKFLKIYRKSSNFAIQRNHLWARLA